MDEIAFASAEPGQAFVSMRGMRTEPMVAHRERGRPYRIAGEGRNGRYVELASDQ